MSFQSVSVVIPVLNGEATISVQIEALLQQDWPVATEIVVVDNGSTDATLDVVKSFVPSAVSIRVIHESRRGINFARNAGVSAASGDLVLLCDADDVVAPGWGPAMVGAATPHAWLAGSLDYVSLNSPSTRRAWSAPPRSIPYEPNAAVDRTYGCNCGFPKMMWVAIDGFEESLSGTGGDETEFFMRARRAGYRGTAVPDAIVAYRLRPGIGNMIRQRFRQGRNQVRSRRLASGELFPPLPSTPRTLVYMWRLVLGAPVRAIRGDGIWLSVSAGSVRLGHVVETALQRHQARRCNAHELKGGA